MSGLNGTFIVVGYGSLMSGYGLSAVRRAGRSSLAARDAFAVRIQNAKRGLAKPSSHGDYLAMDLEPFDSARPITATVGLEGTGLGAMGLVFGREHAEMVARREEYEPGKFVELITLADRARQPVGDFLWTIAERAGHCLLEYRRLLFEVLGYTSPGYIFHPIPLSDGRFALAAIGSGFDGSGDPALASRRKELGMDRLLTLSEAMEAAARRLSHFDKAGQLGYYVECLLGGFHGIPVKDLSEQVGAGNGDGPILVRKLAEAACGERKLFMNATSLDPRQYEARFGGVAAPSIRKLMAQAGIDC